MKSALVGCGRIAKTHAEVLAQMPGVEVIACVDTVRDRASGMANSFKAAVYTDYQQMLCRERPDVVHLCTPHHLHVDMAIAALERGVHVLMEKPAAITPESFDRLLLAQEHSAAAIGVCFQNRYNATTRHLANRLASGELGKVLGARCVVTWQRGADYYADEWHGRAATEGGGVLINQAIHSMDLLVHLLGPASTVQASMHNRHLQGLIEVEDTLEAYLEFDSRPVLFYASLAYCVDAPVMLEVICERATCVLQGEQLSIHHHNDGSSEIVHNAKMGNSGKTYWGTGHKLCIEDYYMALAQERLFPITPRDIKSTMDLVFACYQSAQSGKKVSLN